jgi:flagella basal body P-ring formation protein FlgA
LEPLEGADRWFCRQAHSVAAILAVVGAATLASLAAACLNPGMERLHLLFAWLLMLFAGTALAVQDPAPVRKAVEEYLRVQTKGLPGEVSFTFRGLDPGNQLEPCGALDVSLPPGARAWGRTNLTVRCLAENGWSIFVPVHIHVVAEYVITARPLAQGQTIARGDLASRRGDLSDLPAGVVTDAGQALGRTMTISIAAGHPLRTDMIREPLVVQQNQAVKIVSRGPGFQVSNEGRALNQGTDGQVVQVRLANGQVISGIARPGGIVEIGY